MGIFSTRIRDRYEAAPVAEGPVEPQLRVEPLHLVPTREQFLGMRSLWALTVPAYKRGHDLICSTVAQLPLQQHGQGDSVPASLTTSGEVGWVTKQRTVADLVNHALAFWKITGTLYGPRFTRLDTVDCTLSEDGRVVQHGGKELTVSDPFTPPVLGQVVVFTGSREGCITVGGEVLTTGIALQSATLRYAETPRPTDVLHNVSGFDLTDEEIQKDLADWRQARATSSAAYLNSGYELVDPKGWSPTELALADQKNQNVLDIARLLNIDASYLNAVVGGTSLVYTNRVDLRQDLIDLTCSPYIQPLEQRLSMVDCYGGTVRFSTSAFLRGNVMERAQLAIDLLAAGIIDVDKARQIASDSPGETA